MQDILDAQLERILTGSGGCSLSRHRSGIYFGTVFIRRFLSTEPHHGVHEDRTGGRNISFRFFLLSGRDNNFARLYITVFGETLCRLASEFSTQSAAPGMGHRPQPSLHGDRVIILALACICSHRKFLTIRRHCRLDFLFLRLIILTNSPNLRGSLRSLQPDLSRAASLIAC